MMGDNLQGRGRGGDDGNGRGNAKGGGVKNQNRMTSK